MEQIFSSYISPIITNVDQWIMTNGLSALFVPLLVLVLLLGFAAVLLRNHHAHQLEKLDELEVSLSRREQQSLELHDSLEKSREAFHQLEIEKTRMESEHATMMKSMQSRIDDYQQQWERVDDALEIERQKYQSLLEQHTQIKTSLEEKERQFSDQLKLLNEAKLEMKKDFELLANEVLESKGRAFKEINQESIQNLLTPVQAEMKGFREKVESLHTEETKQRSELKAELVNLQRLNQEITDQAEQLTTALRGQKKVQGNWGELILENVLDNSGLRIGKDYQREVSFTTENGRKRPDAIVYMPQDKHLVIDAKTSLAAYTRYVNAENELERQNALAEHAAAIKDRIAELADRDYYKLPGLNSPEVVIMFIPIESAYVEALKFDETLYQKAIEQNVLVATPTTLLTSLNIVRQLWQFEDRNKHTAELADRAGKFYNKLNSFLTSMQKVGDQLDNARNSYDNALKQLYSGRGNLIKQAAEFKDLGISVQKELPEELVEKAKLELDMPAVRQLESD